MVCFAQGAWKNFYFQILRESYIFYQSDQVVLIVMNPIYEKVSPVWCNTFLYSLKAFSYHSVSENFLRNIEMRIRRKRILWRGLRNGVHCATNTLVHKNNIKGLVPSFRFYGGKNQVLRSHKENYRPVALNNNRSQQELIISEGQTVPYGLLVAINFLRFVWQVEDFTQSIVSIIYYHLL